MDNIVIDWSGSPILESSKYMSDPYNSSIPPIPDHESRSSFPSDHFSSGTGVDLSHPAEVRTTAMLSHLFGVSGFLGALVIFLTQKVKSPFIDYHAKEALNFQITVAIAMVVSVILYVALIGALLLPLVFIYSFAMSIVAGISANEGRYYRYPFAFRLLK